MLQIVIVWNEASAWARNEYSSSLNPSDFGLSIAIPNFLVPVIFSMYLKLQYFSSIYTRNFFTEGSFQNPSQEPLEFMLVIPSQRINN
jgi:hypothetical protein